MNARSLLPRPPLWLAYIAFGALGMCLYLLPTPLKGNEALFNVCGLTSWVAVIVGIRRNKPGYALPWWLFAFGFGCPRCGFSVRGNGARAGWPGSCGRSSSSISSGRIGCGPVEREHVGIRSCSCLPATG